jgi:enamine deaminase RidA (YjgF/YER057c/UK114 family)
MDHLDFRNPPGIAPPRATYSHSVRSSGDVLWLAGQVSIDERGNTVGLGDVARQLEQVMHNIERILAAAGVGWSHVVRFTMYVVGAENVEGARAARAELWPERYPDGNYPTSTFLVVDRLASEEFLVEVETTAVLPR